MRNRIYFNFANALTKRERFDITRKLYNKKVGGENPYREIKEGRFIV